MNRRGFLLAAGAAVSSRRDGWRTFEVTTRVRVLKATGRTLVWLPAALAGETPYQKTLSNASRAERGSTRMVETSADSLGIVTADFPAGVEPVVTLTSRITTRNWTVDPAALPKPPAELPATLQHFLRPTRLLPTGGIVRDTALAITAGAATPLEKARAIYDWVCENTFRDPATRGCGMGDIRFLLESKDLRGKCADLNALYVGLARAAGLPARDAYGIRVARSELEYRSLGVATADVTRAQHCRAEVYIDAAGWIPVDPADVRKVALEEPALAPKARDRLFGSWEMNWIAYNFAHDVALPGSAGAPVPFLMYPCAETGGRRLDSLDPDNFRYEITAREL